MYQVIPSRKNDIKHTHRIRLREQEDSFSNSSSIIDKKHLNALIECYRNVDENSIQMLELSLPVITNLMISMSSSLAFVKLNNSGEYNKLSWKRALRFLNAYHKVNIDILGESFSSDLLQEIKD